MSETSALVGDCDPRQHEFSVQLRTFDSANSGGEAGSGGFAEGPESWA